jgi:hypothetical protein
MVCVSGCVDELTNAPCLMRITRSIFTGTTSHTFETRHWVSKLEKMKVK